MYLIEYRVKHNSNILLLAPVEAPVKNRPAIIMINIELVECMLEDTEPANRQEPITAKLAPIRAETEITYLHLIFDGETWENNEEPYQSAPQGAVWSWSTLLAI